MRPQANSLQTQVTHGTYPLKQREILQTMIRIQRFVIELGHHLRKKTSLSDLYKRNSKETFQSNTGHHAISM